MPGSIPCEEIWSRHGTRAGISARLEPLVRDLYDALVADPVNVHHVEGAVERVLEFLTSPEGRTDANCTAVDYFLCLGEFDCPELPNPVGDVVADMGGALHDTVSSPNIAANFESTPEQLLARLRSRA